MNFNPTIEQHELIDKYLNEESECMPNEDYSTGPDKERNHICRRNAVHVICRHLHSEDNLDAFIPYLALNYFDRFMSRNELPHVHSDMTNNVRLLAFGCLSLAWKMRSRSTYKIFLNKKVRSRVRDEYLWKVERAILRGLGWRLRGVNAFCFIRYFFRVIPKGIFTRRCINEIIIQAQGDIRFTSIRPSLLAASAIAGATMHFYPQFAIQIRKKLATGTKAEIDSEKLYELGMELARMVLQLNIKIESEETFSLGVNVRRSSPDDEPSSTSSTPGKQVPTEQEDSETWEDEVNKALKSLSLRLSPVQEVSEEEEEEELPLTSKDWRVQREGSEIQEEQERYDEPESEEHVTMMNIKLKWIKDYNENLFIDPSYFPPPPTPTEADADRPATAKRAANRVRASKCFPYGIGFEMGNLFKHR